MAVRATSLLLKRKPRPLLLAPKKRWVSMRSYRRRMMRSSMLKARGCRMLENQTGLFKSQLEALRSETSSRFKASNSRLQLLHQMEVTRFAMAINSAFSS